MKSRKPVLVVEDDRIDTMTIRRIFSDLDIGNELQFFMNGEEAIYYLRTESVERPCIILLDINMPRMNGIEFLKEVKKDKRLKSIPVIVLTTSCDKNDREECFGNGAAGYMLKPVEYDDFMGVIQTIDNYWSVSEQP